MHEIPTRHAQILIFVPFVINALAKKITGLKINSGGFAQTLDNLLGDMI